MKKLRDNYTTGIIVPIYAKIIYMIYILTIKCYNSFTHGITYIEKIG